MNKNKSIANDKKKSELLIAFIIIAVANSLNYFLMFLGGRYDFPFTLSLGAHIMISAVLLNISFVMAVVSIIITVIKPNFNNFTAFLFFLIPILTYTFILYS